MEIETPKLHKQKDANETRAVAITPNKLEAYQEI